MKINNYRVTTWKGLLIILLVAGIAVFIINNDNSDFPAIDIPEIKIIKKISKIIPDLSVKSDLEFIPPPPPSMERMKKQGCVADGLLSKYGNVSGNVKVINRSNCYYLHRALETWRQPPNFKQARKIKKKIKKEDLVYGMFIAEAIDTKDNYDYPTENRDFNFNEMCRKGSNNFWGEHTCKPSFKRSEYRKYLRYITEQAMDMGIQSFLFGQIFYQDNLAEPVIPEIILEMREYADFAGIEIVIGAQTNDITDPDYLKLFDFIEGGVGINGSKKIEEGPCHSRWWKKDGDWCWALLWHEDFSDNANNILLHLDWSAKFGDDMSIFTRMSEDIRAKTLRDLYSFFDSRNMGFLMPILTPLPKDNGGCNGKKKRFYSPDEKYSCKDEDTINKILR